MKTIKNCAPRETPTAQRESATNGQMALPLRVEIAGSFPTKSYAIVDSLDVSIAGTNKKDFAEVIVKAVNNHSRLVEALGNVLNSAVPNLMENPAMYRTFDEARQVLKDLREAPATSRQSRKKGERFGGDDLPALDHSKDGCETLPTGLE